MIRDHSFPELRRWAQVFIHSFHVKFTKRLLSASHGVQCHVEDRSVSFSAILRAAFLTCTSLQLEAGYPCSRLHVTLIGIFLPNSGTSLLCSGVLSLSAAQCLAGSPTSVNGSVWRRVKPGPGSGVDRLVEEKLPLLKCRLEPRVSGSCWKPSVVS